MKDPNLLEEVSRIALYYLNIHLRYDLDVSKEIDDLELSLVQANNSNGLYSSFVPAIYAQIILG